MILTTFIAIFAIGLATFALGSIISRPDIAVVGAVIILGVGGVALVEGIVVQTGETIEETENNVTIVQDTYSDISTLTSFRFEFVVLLLGALMVFKSLEELSES